MRKTDPWGMSHVGFFFKIILMSLTCLVQTGGDLHLNIAFVVV